MSRKSIGLILSLLGIVTVATLFRQPIQSWAATQSCVDMLRDHYSNIETLHNAPSFDTYMQRVKLQCRADVAYDEFEQATAAAQRQHGEEAVALYTELIETTEGGWAYRPQRASIYATLGEYEQALADYNFLLVHDAENYAMLEQRGDLYVEMGRYEEALADFEALYRQARQDPSRSDAYLEKIEARIQAVEAQL